MYKLTRHTDIDLHALFKTSIRSFMQRMGVGLIVFLALALGLTFGLAGSVQAQSTEASAEAIAHADVASTQSASDAPDARGFRITSFTWRAHFDQQAAHVLREHSDRAEGQMLQDVIIAATEGSDAIDLTMVLPELLQIVENGSSEVKRLMALQALDAIGVEHARDRLYQRALQRLHRIAQEEPSSHVRNVAATVIKDFQQDK